LRYDGTATASILDNRDITGTFDGRISVFGAGFVDPLAVCEAADHKMEFVLR